MRQALALCCALTVSACATSPSAPPVQSNAEAYRSNDFVVLSAGRGDTSASLARRYLGDAAKYWVIEDFNNSKNFTPGQEIVIPLRSPNRAGVYVNGYQTVPVLCYHRFGLDKSKMVVTPADFARQMEYLAQHDYRVIRISDLIEFLQGKRALPQRAVVVTIDDGYKSSHQYAFPVLRRFNFPATIFVYSDFVGAREGLSWKEMQDMVVSGLIDIQPHSKTHSNLGVAQPGETEAAYQQRIQAETQAPLHDISKNLNLPIHTFAYPYGDTNKDVIEQLKQREYRLAVTVQPGNNAVFAYPYMLQRSMVFGDQDLDTFKKLLGTFQDVDLR